MVNIFTAFKKANDDAIAMQVAQLQSVTVSNLMTPYAQKVKNFFMSVTNRLTNSKFEKTNVIEMQELIQ